MSFVLLADAERTAGIKTTKNTNSAPYDLWLPADPLWRRMRESVERTRVIASDGT